VLVALSAAFPARGISTPGSQHAIGHIAVGNDGLYVSGNGLEAVGFDGSLKWRFLVSVGSTPTLADDGTIYVGSANANYIYALNPGSNPAVHRYHGRLHRLTCALRSITPESEISDGD